MSSMRPKAKRGQMDKKTNAKKSISPSKSANVNTVTALFKKQQEKAEQNKAETNGITCGKEQDSEDAVVFIKEEQSSYFEQKSVGRFSPVIDTYSMHRKDACTPTSAIPGDFLRGENKKLSRRLSLRKVDRESQILQATHFSNEAHVTCLETVSISKKSAESFAVINVGKLHGAVDYQTVRKSSEVLSNCASQVFMPDDCVPSVSSDDFLGSQSAAVSTVQSSETLKLKKTENKNHPSLFEQSECPCFQKEIDLTSSVPGAQENSQKQGTFQNIEPKHMLKRKLSLKWKKSADESDLSIPCKSTLGTSKHEGKDVKAITKSDKETSDPTTEHSERTEAEGDTEQEEKHYLVPYYLENFREVLKTVMEDEYYVHLFSEMDLKYVAAFNSLTEESQKLYIRLFSRKVAWLPMSKIKYLEIAENLAPCLTELVTSYLINSDENLTDLSAVLGTLSAPDLRTLAKSYHLNTTGQQKGQIIQTLVSKSQQNTVASMFGQKTGSVARSMLNRAKKVLGHIYRLLEEPRRVFIRTMMLFSLANTTGDEESGNGGQAQLFQMLLVNIGRVVYPAYIVNRQTRIFRDREDLIRFEEALRLESELLGRTGSGDWTRAYPVFLRVKEQYDALKSDTSRTEWDRGLSEFLRYYTAGSVLVRLLHQGIEIQQRRKDYTAAVSLIRELLSQDVYNLDLHGFWWERLALNLDAHLKQQGQALQAIQDGLADPAVRTGHRLALYLRAESICNKPKSPYKKRLLDFSHEPLVDLPKAYVEGRVLADGVGSRIHQFMTQDSQTDSESGDVTLCNVEQVVLDHYKANGFPQGVHAEGSMVSILFTLYFWDALFMDVADAFHSPYQTQPLDFHTDAFYQRRQANIDARLAAIENSSKEELQRMMTETWETHYSVLCTRINWERFTSIVQIQGLISCMGGKTLAGILGRYARQPRHTRGGFPDLTLWNTDTRQLKICEVKGPGDRLSHKQMMWLDHLLKLGVDAEVCHVKAVGAKKLKRSM